MKLKEIILHISVCLVSLFLVLGLPFIMSDTFAKIINSQADSITSSSVVVDAPSGEYIVLLNKDKHTDEKKLDQWITFFSGEDAGFIMEDIECLIPEGDAGGENMAISLQSKLATNQMSIKRMNPTLLFSRADNSKFDCIVMSKEYADAYSATTSYSNENVEVITLTGEQQ